MARKRRIPERKCVVTGEMRPKKELIRVVRNKEGEVFVDPTGKQNGRGAYLTVDLDVIAKAEETNALGRALKAEIDPAIYDQLREFAGKGQ